MATKSKAAKDDLFAKTPTLSDGDTLLIETKVMDKLERAAAKATVKPKGAVAVLPPPPPQNMLAIIAQAAANPAVDVAKMQALLSMQQDIEKLDRERAFNSAMHAAQSEMPRIARDRKAEHWTYATLEKVSRDIDPVARKHGFSLSYDAEPADAGTIRVVVDVMHTSGMTRRYRFPTLVADDVGIKGSRNKTQVQGSGSSVSYARRYLKCMVFDIAIAGEDIDGAKAKAAAKREVEIIPAITEEQVVQLIELCEAVECPKERFCTHMGVKGIALIPAREFDAAVAALRGYDENRKERAAKAAAAKA